MRIRSRFLIGATALASSLGPVNALATTPLGDYVTFSGFGTLGLVQTDSNEGQFVRDNQSNGATRRSSFNVDSNLGLQLTAAPTHWLSATVQLLSMARGETSINTEVEWAYAKVQPIPGLAVLAGRMPLPTFLVSDVRNVGYANIWMRPPNEVYALSVLNRLEGVQASYGLALKSSTVTLTALGGNSRLDVPYTNDSFSVSRVRGWNLLWESPWVTLRAGRVQGDVSMDEGGTDRYTFSGVGATMDHANIVLQTEYVTRRSASLSGLVDANGWYALAGYRVDSWVPYVSYAKTKDVYSFPLHISGPQSTVAAGLRWDAFKSAAIKFQLERVDTYGTPGISFATAPLTDQLPGPHVTQLAPVTRPVMAFSIAMDVVF